MIIMNNVIFNFTVWYFHWRFKFICFIVLIRWWWSGWRRCNGRNGNYARRSSTSTHGLFRRTRGIDGPRLVGHSFREDKRFTGIAHLTFISRYEILMKLTYFYCRLPYYYTTTNKPYCYRMGSPFSSICLVPSLSILVVKFKLAYGIGILIL